MPIQINQSTADESIQASWWEADEFVYLKPVKSYIIDTRARTRASRIPEGLDWDDIQAMSTSERSNLELFDSGAYQLSLFTDMISRWSLRFPNNADGSVGAVIPCTAEYFALLPDKDGTFIADEIANRSGGRAAQAELKGISFPGPVEDVPVSGEVPTPSAPVDEADTAGV